MVNVLKLLVACFFVMGCGASQGGGATEPGGNNDSAPPEAAGAKAPLTNNPEDVAAIKELLSEAYGSTVMAHDSAAYAKLYAEGTVLWAPPGEPDQTGREGIAEGVQGLFDKFSFQVDPQAEEVEVTGTFAYAIGTINGTLTPRADGDPVRIKFRILWLLEKQSDEWLITHQIWNNKPLG